MPDLLIRYYMAYNTRERIKKILSVNDELYLNETCLSLTKAPDWLTKNSSKLYHVEFVTKGKT